MVVWHLLTPPLITGLFILSIIPVLLLGLFVHLDTKFFYLMDWEILSMLGMNINFPLLFDMISLTFSLVVLTISFSVMMFSVSYMSGDPNLEYFILMVFFFVLSMNLLIFIPHLIMLLLGWDGLGLTSYLLVIYYQNDKSLAAGMVTAMTNRIGDSLLILSSSWAFISSNWMFVLHSHKFMWFMALAVIVGAMTKSAQMPFSAWLPAAMAAPTPVSSLVHSSTLVTAGVYLLIRFYPSLVLYSFFCLFIFYIGVTTCLMASLSALYENDLKKVIALSTLSQLGVMMMALGVGLPNLAFFHLLTHALFKALLFVCAGTIIHSKLNNQDIRMMGNMWKTMPVTCTCLNVANLALCGFPFLAGFYSKDLIIESFMVQNHPIFTSILLMMSVCLTSGYSIRLAVFTLWCPINSNKISMSNDESVFIYVAYCILLTGAIVGGALFSWMLFPINTHPVLPLSLKLLTLSLIILVGILVFVLVKKDVVWPLLHFMNSMWFLSMITSSFLVEKSFKLGNNYWVQENSWMEVMGGKGIMSSMVYSTKGLQKTGNMSFSFMLSFFTMIIVLIMLLM